MQQIPLGTGANYHFKCKPVTPEGSGGVTLRRSYPMVLKSLLSLSLVLADSFASTLRADPAASLVPLGSFVNPTYVGVAPGEPELLCSGANRPNSRASK